MHPHQKRGRKFQPNRTGLVRDNEKETYVLQRRCLRTTRELKAGEVLTTDLLEALRPAPAGSVLPYELEKVVGKKLNRDLDAGANLKWGDMV